MIEPGLVNRSYTEDQEFSTTWFGLSFPKNWKMAFNIVFGPLPRFDSLDQSNRNCGTLLPSKPQIERVVFKNLKIRENRF